MPHASAPAAHRATLDAARIGDPQANWTVYAHYPDYARAFGLAEGEHFQYLQRAAQGDIADAQFELVKLMRGGWLNREDNGELHATDEAPTQATLDEAHQWLERAAAAGHERAQHMLHNLSSAEWDARTEHRSSFGVHVPMLQEPVEDTPEPMNPRTQRLYWVLLTLAVILLAWTAWAMYMGRLTQSHSRSYWSPPTPPAVTSMNLQTRLT